MYSWVTTSLGALCDGGHCRRQKLEHLEEGVKFRGQGHGSFYKTFHLKIIPSLQRSCLNSREHALPRFHLALSFCSICLLSVHTHYSSSWTLESKLHTLLPFIPNYFSAHFLRRIFFSTTTIQFSASVNWTLIQKFYLICWWHFLSIYPIMSYIALFFLQYRIPSSTTYSI